MSKFNPQARFVIGDECSGHQKSTMLASWGFEPGTQRIVQAFSRGRATDEQHRQARALASLPSIRKKERRVKTILMSRQLFGRKPSFEECISHKVRRAQDSVGQPVFFFFAS